MLFFFRFILLLLTWPRGAALTGKLGGLTDVPLQDKDVIKAAKVK